MKYKLIRILDVAGLQVFQPLVLLCYGEEPRHQLKQIALYIGTPLLVMAACVWMWNFLGPRHKTRSGEVPTPWRVVEAYDGIVHFHNREYTKLADYEREGVAREEALGEAQEELAGLDQAFLALAGEANRILENLTERDPSASESLNSKDQTPRKMAEQQVAIVDQQVAELAGEKIAPSQHLVDLQADVYRHRQALRQWELQQQAEGLSSGETDRRAAYVSQVRDHQTQTDQEQAHLQQLREELAKVKQANAPDVARLHRKLSHLQQQAEFLTQRINLLTDGSRAEKLAEVGTQLETAQADLATAQGPELFVAAQNVLRQEQRLARVAGSRLSKPPTFFDQIATSLKCVFAGFLIATAIAIPVGIFCGMSRVVMASLTPLISLFKPVSPIVWLPIVFIIVGGFIEKPEEAWVQPAFLSSAITVALCSLWPTLVNTALGVASIDQDHLNVARVLRLGLWDRLTKIVIPSALPLIFTGLRISLGVGWMVLIAAELLSSSPGLGKFVWDMFNNGSSETFAQMFVVCGFVGIIGLLLDRIMIVCQRLVSFDGAPSGL